LPPELLRRIERLGRLRQWLVTAEAINLVEGALVTQFNEVLPPSAKPRRSLTRAALQGARKEDTA
jgi:hypothetical protein